MRGFVKIKKHPILSYHPPPFIHTKPNPQPPLPLNPQIKILRSFSIKGVFSAKYQKNRMKQKGAKWGNVKKTGVEKVFT